MGTRAYHIVSMLSETDLFGRLEVQTFMAISVPGLCITPGYCLS